MKNEVYYIKCNYDENEIIEISKVKFICDVVVPLDLVIVEDKDLNKFAVSKSCICCSKREVELKIHKINQTIFNEIKCNSDLIKQHNESIKHLMERNDIISNIIDSNNEIELL